MTQAGLDISPRTATLKMIDAYFPQMYIAVEAHFLMIMTTSLRSRLQQMELTQKSLATDEQIPVN